MGKFSIARSVWIPQQAEAGTSRSPIRSCSVLVAAVIVGPSGHGGPDDETPGLIAGRAGCCLLVGRIGRPPGGTGHTPLARPDPMPRATGLFRICIGPSARRLPDPLDHRARPPGIAIEPDFH